MGMSDDGMLDWELLDQYAQKGVQDAFAQIVKRYVDLVYMTCFRDLRDHHLAEDATQAVFLVLAQKAGALRREVVLAGWLFHTARLVVRNIKKQEARRKARERSAAEMLQKASPTELSWGGLSPLLSEGLENLGHKDRDAVLLHYFQHKSLAEVGRATGVSEDAARMRVSRAVQKLRSFFSRKGQTLAVGAVATLLMASSVQAAPPTCAASVVAVVCGTAAHTALAGSSAAALANAATKALFLSKLKMAAAVAAVTLLVPAASLATYRVITTRQEPSGPLPAANNMPSEGVALGPAPAVAHPAGQPAPARPSTGSSKSASRPKSLPSPQAQNPKPDTLKDRLRFKVEGGRLTADGPAAPADGKPVRIALRGVSGETTISRKPASLRVENSRTADRGEIRTRVQYEPGGGIEIQRSARPRSGKEYAILLRQNQGNDAAAKVGQTTLQVTADSGENWTSWTADDFPRFVESYPLAYFAHVAPVLRDLSSSSLFPVPARAGRQALSEAKAAAPRPALAEVLSQRNNSSVAILWRREIEMLNRDVGFLTDCLESDELDVRTAALKQLTVAAGRPVAFDVNAPAEKRRAMLNALRHGIGPMGSAR
jgi:RNA polymerase sigma factor (sigma-70 family)